MRRFGFIGIAIIAIVVLGLAAYNVMAADIVTNQKVTKDSKVAPTTEKNATALSAAITKSNGRKAIATKRANTRHAINYTYKVNPAEIERAMKALGYNLSPAERKQLGKVAKFWQKLFSSKEMQASFRQIQTELAKSPEFRKLFANATDRKSLVIGKNTGRRYNTRPVGHRTIRKGSALRTGKNVTAKRGSAKFTGRKPVIAKKIADKSTRHYAAPRTVKGIRPSSCKSSTSCHSGSKRIISGGKRTIRNRR